MALDTAQQQLFKQWLADKHVHTTCPACGASTQWEADAIITAPRMEADGTHIDDRLAPMIQVRCQHCAYILLFAGIPIGIHPRARASRSPQHD
jgi:hypothetical protein